MKILCRLYLLGSLVTGAMLSSARADVPVLIFAGQSNMGGYQSDTRQLQEADVAEQPNVFFYGDNGLTWATLNLAERPTQPGNVAAAGFGFGPEAIVGADLVKAGVFKKVLEIKFAMNGSPNDSFLSSPADGVKGNGTNPITSSWAPHIKTEGTQVSLYDMLLARIQTARDAYTAQHGEKTYIAGFFWMQGESDANSSPEVAQIYDQNLKKFVTALRKDLKAPDMPFVFGRIRDGAAFANDLVVRAGQDNVVTPGNAQFVPKVFEVDTDSFPLSGDNVHFSSDGTVLLGHGMVDGYQAVVKKN